VTLTCTGIARISMTSSTKSTSMKGVTFISPAARGRLA
jgi:hypothetical protein